MGRGAFAFRDLDEELQTFVDDNSVVHVYQSHSSPPALRTEALKPKPGNLSDSMVLKRYIDHNKAQRRRKLLGGALFVGVALLGSLPMLMMESQKGELQSPLELALGAPYKALRVRGEILRPSVDNRGEADDGEADRWVVGPDVGDFDPHDDGKGKTRNAGAKETREEEEGENGEEEEDQLEETEAEERRGAGTDDMPQESTEEMLTGKIIKILHEQEEEDEQREQAINT